MRLAALTLLSPGGFLDICSLCAAIDCDLNAHMPSSWIDNTPRYVSFCLLALSLTRPSFTAFRFDIDGTSFGIVTFPGEGLVELGWEVRNGTLAPPAHLAIHALIAPPDRHPEAQV